MLINPPEDWKTTPQVPEQVRDKQRISTGQFHDLLHTTNVLVLDLIEVIGDNEWSVSQLMEKTGLKHRPNFIEYHLNPAIAEGYIHLLYPQSP